jgi:hypothetical protein
MKRECPAGVELTRERRVEGAEKDWERAQIKGRRQNEKEIGARADKAEREVALRGGMAEKREVAADLGDWREGDKF